MDGGELFAIIAVAGVAVVRAPVAAFRAIFQTVVPAAESTAKTKLPSAAVVNARVPVAPASATDCSTPSEHLSKVRQYKLVPPVLEYVKVKLSGAIAIFKIPTMVVVDSSVGPVPNL